MSGDVITRTSDFQSEKIAPILERPKTRGSKMQTCFQVDLETTGWGSGRSAMCLASARIPLLVRFKRRLDAKQHLPGLGDLAHLANDQGRSVQCLPRADRFAGCHRGASLEVNRARPATVGSQTWVRLRLMPTIRTPTLSCIRWCRGVAMRGKLIAALMMAMPSPALANCPIGSYPWVDQWGTKICKRHGDGSTATKQGSLDNCPPGTHPSVDNWGTRTCKSFGSQQQFYDTSKGCPLGTYSWLDSWGNKICKRF